ncbi:hypothetical protein BH24ACT5_BH24ACT5_29200 [soil metagenome]
MPPVPDRTLGAQNPAGSDAPSAEEWLAIVPDDLPVAAASGWAVRPDCGAVVKFTGVVRDHAEGRDGVEQLEYEAYESAAGQRMQAIVAELRRRWPTVGRVAMLHRVGRLDVSDPAVVVVVSAPHRGEAFDAARFAIDTLKESAPIWKHETWSDGADWGTAAAAISAVPNSATSS